MALQLALVHQNPFWPCCESDLTRTQISGHAYLAHILIIFSYFQNIQLTSVDEKDLKQNEAQHYFHKCYFLSLTTQLHIHIYTQSHIDIGRIAFPMTYHLVLTCIGCMVVYYIHFQRSDNKGMDHKYSQQIATNWI